MALAAMVQMAMGQKEMVVNIMVQMDMGHNTTLIILALMWENQTALKVMSTIIVALMVINKR